MISTQKREIYVHSRFCTLGCLLSTTFSFITLVIFPNMTSCVSVSLGLVYKIKEKPKLRVETTLVNASLYRDLLSIDSLVNSRLVPATSEEMSNILDQIKKRSHTDCAPSNSSIPPKKSGATRDVSLIRVLPPPPSVETEGIIEKSSAKIPVVSAPSKSQSRSFQRGEDSDFLSPFRRELARHVK